MVKLNVSSCFKVRIFAPLKAESLQKQEIRRSSDIYITINKLKIAFLRNAKRHHYMLFIQIKLHRAF